MQKKRLKKNQLPIAHVLMFIIMSLFGFFFGSEFGGLTPKNTIHTYEQTTISFVVDGDSVKTTDDMMIRYLGIDAPEYDESFGEESKQFNSRLVFGNDVVLEYDFDRIDMYGRTLAYVWVIPPGDIAPLSELNNDGQINISVELVRQGLAKAFVFDGEKQLKYKQELLEAEMLAKEENRGIWK